MGNLNCEKVGTLNCQNVRFIGCLQLILEKGRIILKPKSAPRKGWKESFKQMHLAGDDKLGIDDIFNDETFEEWK